MPNLFDLHCDTLCRAFANGCSFFSSDLHISFNKCSFFSNYAQIMAIWTDDKISDSEGFIRYKQILKFAKAQGLEFLSSISTQSNISLFLAIEDLRIIENDLSRLDDLFNDGVRIITPMWKGVNVIGGAWDTNIGLSDFGKIALKKALELGMIIDVSHASRESFYDILKLCFKYDKIPIATHSNSFSACSHFRNLTDEQFSILCCIKSIVGISLAPEHLSSNAHAKIDDIIRHIDKYLSLGGESSVCLGCDFDGVSSLPVGISDISDLETLYYKMQLHFGNKITEKIFSHNSCDFMTTNLL